MSRVVHSPNRGDFSEREIYPVRLRLAGVGADTVRAWRGVAGGA